MIFEEKKILFIHYPKTGGNSVQDALRNYTSDRVVALGTHHDGHERFEVRNDKYGRLVKHSRLRDYQRVLGKHIFDYKIYITIRNPFDRLVSFYFSPHRGNVVYQRDEFYEFIKTVSPLEDYIWIREGFFRKRQVFGNVHFLKYESLSSEFHRLADDLGLQDVTLPHRNKSVRGAYSKYYDEAMVSKVKELHEFEIKIGDYHF